MGLIYEHHIHPALVSVGRDNKGHKVTLELKLARALVIKDK